MGLRRVRDPRLADQNNKTNVLSGQATTGTGQDQQQEQVGITGTSNQEGGASVPKTSTNTNQAQQQNQQQAQQQTQQQSNAATKMPKQPARSGMFTNIKNILQKNEPAVQQMGQQAGQQFATTAQKVKEQAQQQAKSAQERILQSQQAVQGQEQAGLAAINAAVNTEPPIETETTTTETAPSTTATEVPEQTKEVEPTKELELADFAATAKKTAEGTSQLDLSEKIKEARALQAQSQGIMTEAAKRNLLRDVFGRGQRQYTSGGQSLDNLLLAMSPKAGKQLTETVQQSGRGLEDISRLQSQGEAQYQNLLNLSGGVEKRLGEASQSSLDQLFGNIESGTENFKQERQAYLQDFVKKGREVIQAISKNAQNLAKYSPEDLLLKMGAKQSSIWEEDYLGRPKTGPSGGVAGSSYTLNESQVKDFYNKNNLNYFYSNYSDFKKALNLPKADEKGNITVSDTTASYSPSGVEYSTNKDFVNNPIEQTIRDSIKNRINYVTNPTKNIYGLDYVDPYITKEIEKATGVSYYDLIKDSDIEEGRYYGYSDADIAKINAIKKLRGETDFIVPSKNYTSLEDLQSIDYFDKLFEDLGLGTKRTEIPIRRFPR